MVSPYAFTWSQGDMCTVLYATRPTTPPMDAATPTTSIHITWSVGAPVKNRPKAFKNRQGGNPRGRLGHTGRGTLPKVGFNAGAVGSPLTLSPIKGTSLRVSMPPS